LFTEAVAAGKTVVMVTHDMELAQRAGRVLRIADGQFIDPRAAAPWAAMAAEPAPSASSASNPAAPAAEPAEARP
jgi:energy-coupling factor transporter ATP-binding protein EcfA2